MATEIEKVSEVHSCMHTACKCKVRDGECCGDFCGNVDSTGEDPHCGCGHTDCDMTAEMGNEGTFASSGS
ncbi:MAG: hypothetical protein WC028_08605 [Candidatus Obscuribacterales bacterium]|jgi:hypothetical protein